MKIDPKSHVPIYLQIAEGIRSAVAAGVYRPGEALPSLRTLAIDVRVNPNTVQRAYDQLEREGLVYSERGRGLFVAEGGSISAQDRARDAIGRTFEQGIRAGQAAGLDGEQVREIFEAAINRLAQAGVISDEHQSCERSGH